MNSESFIRKRILPLVLGAALLCMGAVPARGQATVNELFRAVHSNMRDGNFAEVVPDVQQLVHVLGDSDETAVRLRMQGVFLNLGIAHFFLGNFGEAIEAFEDYKRRYPRTSPQNLATADLFIADCLRFQGEFEKAIEAYRRAMQEHSYRAMLRADMHSSIARCHLAQDNWADAMEPLQKVIRLSSDFNQYNWAATLLVTAYLKTLELENVYALVPLLLQRDSLASRSVAFNMAALEAGDELFATERYREALWVFRMVYPHGALARNSKEHLAWLQEQAGRIRDAGGDARSLMRLQESIGELEEEQNAIAQIDNYDIELQFRVARGYMELRRYREAIELFLHLNQVAEPDLADEALFLAFRCASSLEPWDQAYELGLRYMDDFPAGHWFPIVSLAIGQMYASEQRWMDVIEHLTRTLEISPNHTAAAECLFLIGYASFMEEKFEQAVENFSELNRRFPQSDLRPDATYWSGMARLFDAEYEAAAPHFDAVIDQFSDSIYLDDAMFRRAVCDYGTGDFEASDLRLAEFIERFEDHELAGEATMMRGDVAGGAGRIDEAVAFYQRAMNCDHLNIEHYNHCAFQTATLLHDAEKHEEQRAHFARYIERNREGSNIPQAIYWIGRSLWNAGDVDGALHYYRNAVAEHGQDPGAIGIDLILDEWIGLSRRGGAETEARAWTSLRAARDEAEREEQRTLVLRLTRVLLYDPDASAGDRHRLMRRLLDRDNLPYASPAVAQVILNEAIENERRELAELAARHIVDAFAETDHGLQARMVLAEFAIEDARNTASLTERDELHAQAMKHLDIVRSVHAAAPEAAQALLSLGWLHLEDSHYEEAEEMFTAVLGPRAWSHMRPEALYGRGETLFAQRKFEEATAYYERIYLMYSHYQDWTAKAYLRRAECLVRLFRNDAAREVLTEMLEDPERAQTPQGRRAQTMLNEELRR